LTFEFFRIGVIVGVPLVAMLSVWTFATRGAGKRHVILPDLLGFSDAVVSTVRVSDPPASSPPLSG
jgi:hypothetical protein